MSCDEYFSFSNLGGSSFETEIGYSTLCVSNKAKAAILLVWKRQSRLEKFCPFFLTSISHPHLTLPRFPAGKLLFGYL